MAVPQRQEPRRLPADVLGSDESHDVRGWVRLQVVCDLVVAVLFGRCCLLCCFLPF